MLSCVTARQDRKLDLVKCREIDVSYFHFARHKLWALKAWLLVIPSDDEKDDKKSIHGPPGAKAR